MSSSKEPIPIPDLQPAERRRLERLFAAVLPPSYQNRGFSFTYRRMLSDLDQYRQRHPTRNSPSPEQYLAHIGSDDWVCHFEIASPDSICRLAHREAKSDQ